MSIENKNYKYKSQITQLLKLGKFTISGNNFQNSVLFYKRKNLKNWQCIKNNNFASELFRKNTQREDKNKRSYYRSACLHIIKL